MNLRQALYMKTIAEKGGITAAAKQLYISQPSLSQMLRQIEEEVGVPLFDRSSLSFRPTYAGERYLHAASVLLNTNEILENELREIRGEERGRKPRNTPWGEWMDVWFENYAKVKVRPSSHQTYRGYIDNHIKPNIGKISLSKLTSLELQKFYKKLLSSGRVERIESKK